MRPGERIPRTAEEQETFDNLADHRLAFFKEDDTLLERQARIYLRSRIRRRRIEDELGSRLDAFPYKIVEVIRGFRLARTAGIEVRSLPDIHNTVLKYARFILDESPAIEPYLSSDE